MGYPPNTPDASTYRFLTSNILTGQVKADSLPIQGDSASRTINAIGQFDGHLQLSGSAPTSVVQKWVQAVTPWKSILWILQDDHPIWNGLITGWNVESISDGVLPIQAATVEEIFQHRIVTNNLSFDNVDVFEIFRKEMDYALGKKPNGQVAGTGKFQNQSGILSSTALSGVLGDVIENVSLKTIYTCFTDLINNFGLEYTFEADRQDAQSLYTRLKLGLPLLGRPFSQTGLQFVFPSKGAIDYAWEAIATFPANRLVLSGQGAQVNSSTTGFIPGGTVQFAGGIQFPGGPNQPASGGTVIPGGVLDPGPGPIPAPGTAPSANPASFLSQLPHGQSNAELASGYPLLEESYAIQGIVQSQAQINAFADFLLPGLTVTNSLTPRFTMGSQAFPRIRDVQLGDEVMVAVTSPLHPPRNPGLLPGVIAKFRLSGWTLTFPSPEQDEQAVFQLGNGLAISLSGNLSSDIFTGGPGGIP